MSAPNGTFIEYSIGGAYQTNNTFSGLGSGSYNITARNSSTGCVSAITVVVIDPIPGAPAAPTASVVSQPSCTTPTSTIVVSAPTGGNFQYSIGGTFQSSNTFPGLTPGNYNVTVKDISTGCISSIASRYF